MPSSTYVVALVGGAILFMVYRQFASRPVGESRRSLVVALVLVAWGLASVSHVPLGGLSGLALTAAGVTAGLILGLIRGSSMRIWEDEQGVTWQRGTIAVALLWVVSIAVRIGLGLVAGHTGVSPSASLAEMPLFFGATLAAQNAYVLAMVRRGWAGGANQGMGLTD